MESMQQRSFPVNLQPGSHALAFATHPLGWGVLTQHPDGYAMDSYTQESCFSLYFLWCYFYSARWETPNCLIGQVGNDPKLILFMILLYYDLIIINLVVWDLNILCLLYDDLHIVMILLYYDLIIWSYYIMILLYDLIILWSWSYYIMSYYMILLYYANDGSYYIILPMILLYYDLIFILWWSSYCYVSKQSDESGEKAPSQLGDSAPSVSPPNRATVHPHNGVTVHPNNRATVHNWCHR